MDYTEARALFDQFFEDRKLRKVHVVVPDVVLQALEGSDDVIPASLREAMELPLGTTYDGAVTAIRAGLVPEVTIRQVP